MAGDAFGHVSKQRNRLVVEMEYYPACGEFGEAVAATFKVLVLGDSNVGKTSLIKSYSTKKRPGNLMPTIGRCLGVIGEGV